MATFEDFIQIEINIVILMEVVHRWMIIRLAKIG